jgi:hypothetical protein
MDKARIIAALKEQAGGDEARMATINRLAAALRLPSSFDELEGELPPAARYLGPGVWMDAIHNGNE